MSFFECMGKIKPFHSCELWQAFDSHHTYNVREGLIPSPEPVACKDSLAYPELEKINLISIVVITIGLCYLDSDIDVEYWYVSKCRNSNTSKYTILSLKWIV